LFTEFADCGGFGLNLRDIRDDFDSLGDRTKLQSDVDRGRQVRI